MLTIHRQVDELTGLNEADLALAPPLERAIHHDERLRFASVHVAGVMHPRRARCSITERLPAVAFPGSTTRHRKSRWLSTATLAGSTWVT
jgi:hypothetical protein